MYTCCNLSDEHIHAYRWSGRIYQGSFSSVLLLIQDTASVYYYCRSHHKIRSGLLGLDNIVIRCLIKSTKEVLD